MSTKRLSLTLFLTFGLGVEKILQVLLCVTSTHASDVKVFYFYRKFSAEFEACEKQSNIRSRLVCAGACSKDVKCAAFNHTDITHTCKVCYGEKAKELLFFNTSYFYWETTTIETTWLKNSTYMDRVLQVEDGLKPGTVVHLEGIYTNYTEFQMNFIKDAADFNLQFRPRLSKNSNNTYISLNYRQNYTWGTELSASFSFPFVPGQHFDVHFLVRAKDFLIYINGDYFSNFTHVWSPLNITSIRVVEYIQVIKLSY